MNATTAAEAAALPSTPPPAPYAPSFQDLPLDKIHAGINPRKTFDEKGLEQLRDSIAMQGVMQPILVRPHPTRANEWQVVAGERRVRASRLAKQLTIPALVRTLDDTQALKLAITENLQREDVHELEEAEGYKALMAAPHKYTTEAIAKELGKSESYVLARLKLLALHDEGRKAFLSGKIDTSRALLIARVPTAELQAKALKLATDAVDGGEPRSYRQFHQDLRNGFMTPFTNAGWSPKDAALLPSIGACTTCKHNSANARDLFDDIKGADVCTNPPCFRDKTAAHSLVLKAKAIDEGRKVIEGKAAKEIFPHANDKDDNGQRYAAGAYARLDQDTYVNGRGYVKPKDVIKGTDIKPTLVIVGGNAIEVVHENDLKAAVKAKDGPGAATSSRSPEEKKREAAMKLENETRRIAWHKAREAITANYNSPADDATNTVSVRIDYLRLLAAHALEDASHDDRLLIVKLWEDKLEPASEPAPVKGKPAKPLPAHERHGHYSRMLELAVSKMSPAELLQLLSDCAVAGRLKTHTYSKDFEDAGRLTGFCDALGVNLAKERADTKAEHKAEANAKEKAKTAKKAPAKADKQSGITVSQSATSGLNVVTKTKAEKAPA